MTEEATPMDYEEHERTFAGFIEFTKLGVVACLNILVLLCLFAFGGGFGTVAGWVLLFLMIVALAVGVAFRTNKWTPSGGVLALSVIVAILALS